MKVLVDSSGYALNNVGDVAMLQAAVSRLQALWPDASIGVLTSSTTLLAGYCPGAEPVPANGLRKWLLWSQLPGRSRVPRALSRRFAASDSIFRDHLPGLSDGLAARRAKGHDADRADIETFLESADAADLLVLGGGGYMTDSFRGHALSSLELLSRFQRRGAPTAMVGQGIGPVSDPVILRRARAILPRVDMICLREGRAALTLLDSLSVSRARVRVTGDDAIELAFESRPHRLGSFLGVNVRVSSYSSVPSSSLGEIRSALRKAAEGIRATLLPIAISRATADSDVAALHELLPLETEGPEPEGLDTPIGLARRVGQCRVVVTGSYHAGVFALAQGIPVIGLTRSAYYSDKFLGLADQFGAGCRVVSLDQPEVVDILLACIRELWREADDLRPPLLTAAARQVREGHEAYAVLHQIAEGRKASELPASTTVVT